MTVEVPRRSLLTCLSLNILPTIDQQFDDLPQAPDKRGSQPMSAPILYCSPARSQSIFRLTAITIASTMNRPMLPISSA